MRLRSTYYEHGNKASRPLAHQLRCQAALRMISQIKGSSGTLHTDPTTINSVFCSFYLSLYKSLSPSDTVSSSITSIIIIYSKTTTTTPKLSQHWLATCLQYLVNLGWEMCLFRGYNSFIHLHKLVSPQIAFIPVFSHCLAASDRDVPYPSYCCTDNRALVNQSEVLSSFYWDITIGHGI